ncbi:hypothetical protein PNA2_0301 [Pyrococcus sp. NA2]|uniref:hypothetical protein n=1 Tax=Pyrococcus sp. (strain NA2) TaxID=342949 RepID=UPI000209B046|nr:hypothetical protein [Pyrococcus sp. NA2]AEC51219.1 hypothetical protein PNA2_0301 [Pyrococcus sp. NA2]
MMEKLFAFALAILVFGVAISGCIGGTQTETYSQKPSPSPSETSPHSETTTSPETTPSETTTPETTTTHQETTTTTPQETPTQTETPVETAYWSPWSYENVKIDGEEYKVTGYKLYYKIRPSPDSEIYEYEIEKSVEKTRVRVFGRSMTGDKVDLGEKDVYEYKTIIAPIKSINMEDKLTIRFWVTAESEDMFLYPWNIGWAGVLSPMGSSGDIVGVEFEYMGEKFTITNPSAFRNDLFPYFEGNSDWISDLNDDLVNIYTGWVAMVNLALWSAWSDKNVLVPQHGTWSDGMHSWEWSTKPDGETVISGFKFRVIKAEWKYTGGPESIELSGSGKFAPEIFMPLEVNGKFSSRDPDTGEEIVIYGAYRLEEIKLEKI